MGTDEFFDVGKPVGSVVGIYDGCNEGFNDGPDDGFNVCLMVGKLLG